MSWILNTLHFYKNYVEIEEELVGFLIEKTMKNLNLCNQLFWTITQNMSQGESRDYFKLMRARLVNKLEPQWYKIFQTGYDFTTNIIKIAQNDNEHILENIQRYLRVFPTIDNIKLPIDLNKTFDGIDIDKIKILDSKTRPIILPCIYTNKDNNSKQLCNIMLKKEDSRKEDIVMKMIKLIDIFLKREEGLDLYITSYNILPISNEYGYIEFVEKSHTLYSIREEMGFTIQNYLLEKNQNMSLLTFRDRFTKSCAAYCVITYILGIGDRHLDNMMVSENGCLFHIDFGYILGRDPKLVSPEIRLTLEMVDAMGGYNSIHFQKFKDYCGRAYNCIRRHANIFYVLLLSLTNFQDILEDQYITPEYIKNYILVRFIPGENYKEADLQFKYKIDTNLNTYSENVIDYFHKKNKGTSNLTPDTTTTGILDKAKTISINVKDTIMSGISSWFSVKK